MSKQTTKLDSKGRVSIGKHTDREPGAIFHIVKGDGGAVTLIPGEEGPE